MSLWDYCKICQCCCNGVLVNLTDEEKKILGREELNNVLSPCEFCKENGCTAKIKPLDCYAYPVLIVRKGLSFDYSCPLFKIYFLQLFHVGSEARKHLESVREKVKNTKKEDLERYYKETDQFPNELLL